MHKKLTDAAYDQLKFTIKFSIGVFDLLNDWRNGKETITSDIPDGQSTSEEKAIAVKTVQNLLAGWYFLTNLMWLIKRWLALQINLEKKEKIVLTLNRATRLGLMCYGKLFKTT